MTTAAIRRSPLPLCGACERRLCPEHPELAGELLEYGTPEFLEHPYLGEHMAQVESVERGQRSHVQRGRQVRGMHEIAAERVAPAMRDDAAARRAAQLAQYRDAGTPWAF